MIKASRAVQLRQKGNTDESEKIQTSGGNPVWEKAARV